MAGQPAPLSGRAGSNNKGMRDDHELPASARVTPPPAVLVNEARQSLSRTWSGLRQSAASLYEYRKFKRVVAVAAMLAGSVFGSTAQAEIVQLNLSGDSFSGYLFLDTSSYQANPSDSRLSYYYGISYISTPISTGGSFAYTTNPMNPFTNSPVQNNAQSPYLIGDVFLESFCDGSFCSYYIEPSNWDGSIAILNVPIGKQSSIANMIDGSFPKTRISFDLYSDFRLPPLFSGTGTISLPAATAAVPEPASWAMMIAGFGMIGGAARYRRRRTTVAYA